MRTAIAGLAVLLCCGPVRAGLVAYSADAATKTLSLTYEWPAVPDFFTVDAFGRAYDEVAVWIDPSALLPDPQGLGGYRGQSRTIRTTGRMTLDGPAPISSVVTDFPYALSGSTMNFTVPLGSFETDGTFKFKLLTVRYGETQYVSPVISATNWQTQRPVITPTPAAWTGGATLLMLGAAVRRCRLSC